MPHRQLAVVAPSGAYKLLDIGNMLTGGRTDIHAYEVEVPAEGVPEGAFIVVAPDKPKPGDLIALNNPVTVRRYTGLSLATSAMIGVVKGWGVVMLFLIHMRHREWM